MTRLSEERFHPTPVRRSPGTWALRGLVAVLFLFFVGSAAALADSVKIALPTHIKIGKAYGITLTGFVPNKGEVTLNSDTRPCATTFNAESKRLAIAIYVGGQIVSGHFRYVYPIPGPQVVATKRTLYFCAYLMRLDLTSSTAAPTTAHASRRFRIPS